MSVYIFIPTFNDGQFIRQSIESIKAQTFKDYICVINDDVSQDNTREEVRSAILGDDRFVLICQEVNGGGLKNESTLIELGKRQYLRKYIFYFSGHDVVTPTYLEDAVSFLDNNSDYAMASSTMRSFVDSPENSIAMPEAEYNFFLMRGVIAFLNSVIELVNCTIMNSVFRSELLFQKDLFPIEEQMKGNDHLMISWLVSLGFVSISRNSTYFRRIFPPHRDHRPSIQTRSVGISKSSRILTQDELHRSMSKNYLRVFRTRFSDLMEEAELIRFESFIFETLYRRFPYNIF